MNAKTRVRTGGGAQRTSTISRLRPACILALFLCAFSAASVASFGQSRRDLPPGTSTHPIPQTAPAEETAPAEPAEEPQAEVAEAVPVEVTPVEVPPTTQVPVEQPVTLPSYAPGFFNAYVPQRDTNAAIGVAYPSGSIDFVHVFAGRPRPGDPRLPSATSSIQPVAEAPSPYIYEIPEINSRGVLIRRTDREFVQEFPPGSSIRRAFFAASQGASASAAGARTQTASGAIAHPTEVGRYRDDFVQNFPPGARLVRAAAPAPQR